MLCLNVHRAEYLPREVGSHLLEVLVGGRVAATHNVQVVDPARVRAMDIEDAIVNRPIAFRGSLIYTVFFSVSYYIFLQYLIKVRRRIRPIMQDRGL